MRSYRGYKPLVQEIRLVDYELGTTNYNGEVLVRDIGWLKIDDGSDRPEDKSFFVDTWKYLYPITYFRFNNLEITKKEMTGYYEYGGPSAPYAFPYTFKALKK